MAENGNIEFQVIAGHVEKSFATRARTRALARDRGGQNARLIERIQVSCPSAVV